MDNWHIKPKVETEPEKKPPRKGVKNEPEQKRNDKESTDNSTNGD
jgi:hypothetical protein